jgi:predicted ATP-binding protein involved in virulence
MKIIRISLSGLRAFSQAEFSFQPGMNLLVGVNGVGKTTTLDALRVSLSRVLPEITMSRSQKQTFEVNDIKLGLEAMQVSCDFLFDKKEFNLLIYKQRENFNKNETGNPRAQTTETPDKEQINPSIKSLFPKSKKSKSQPLGIFYSTRRSLLVDQKPSSTSTAGGQAAAFAETLLINRENNLRILAQWFKAQEELGEEKPIFFRHISILRQAITEFLPGFSNLHVIEYNGNLHFMIEKNNIPLSVFQLSDGERGVISMVLDLAKRLSQANPNLENPLRDGSAIVLIDELDLHLHPKWQRTIVGNLIRTFPNCQFIATTHSPQIIGEVHPNCITIINNGTYHPATSYGVDSSRVLAEILDTAPRNKEVNALLSSLYKALDEEKLKEAKEFLTKLKTSLGPDDPEITRSSTMISFLEDELNNEADKKKK